jgi:tRNA G37 N-methylase TrmD
MKAPPIIAAVQSIMSSLKEDAQVAFVFPSPSSTYFDQSAAHVLTDTYTDVIFLC